MRKIKKGDTIGLIVSANIDAANVFNSYGINFFTRGDRTIEEACINHNVPIVSLLDDLSRFASNASNGPDFLNMSIRSLTHYILRRHHRFTESRLIYIKHALSGILKEYPDDADLLQPIKGVFEDLSMQLTVQMNYEEFLVYPSIEKMTRKNTSSSLQDLRRVHQHLAYMKEESSRDVELFGMLAVATHNYTAKGKDETLYNITYRAIRELEDDVKIHLHLENNVLFPKVLNQSLSRTDPQKNARSSYNIDDGIY